MRFWRRGLHFCLVLVRTLAPGRNAPSEAVWISMSLQDADRSDACLTNLRDDLYRVLTEN